MTLQEKLLADGFLDSERTSREVADHFGEDINAIRAALANLETKRLVLRMLKGSGASTFCRPRMNPALLVPPPHSVPKVFGERCYMRDGVRL